MRDGGSAKRYWASRHTFTLGLPAVLRVDAASPTRNGLDAYVLVLGGHAQDGTGTVLGRDDNSGPSSGARLAGLRLEPGDYTIEVTTAKKRHTGDYRLRVQARLGVRIEDLHGSSRIGTGTAVDHFTVLPADATCTPDTGNITAGDRGQRALTADLTALGDTTVTVTCRRAGYRTAAATATLTALDPVTDLTVDAASGGTCTKHHGTLEDGVDSQYACTMTRGQTMTLQAEATSPSARTVLGWAAAAGVRAVPAAGDLDASVVGDTVTFTRTGTATVTCTSHGRVTVTARIGVAVHHTAKVAVTCQPPVQITNYTPGTRNGPGPITGTYNVAPAAADCTARNAGGITGTPVPGGTGTARTVAVTATATGTLDIEVECKADHHATSTATAQFRADDEAACSTDLGVLWHGSIARTGTLSTASCVSDKRTPNSGTFHADRYTFTMATAGWVTIDLEGTGEGPEKLDTYLVVLYGHGSGGVERIRDDDSGGDGDAQVADVLLAAGRYTIEATTASNAAQGGYRLRVGGDFAARAPDQPSRTIATVGRQITRSWAHQPGTAKVTVQSVAPDGLDASIVSDDGLATLTASAARAGEYAVTVAYTASGHTSTRTTIIDADCPPRHIETQTRTCIPIATALPTGCTPTALHDGRIWGRRDQSGQYLLYSRSADGDCDSLTQDDKAIYYAFSLPKRLPVELELRDVINMATLRAGGAPSMTLWRVQSTHPVTGRVVGFEATASTSSSSGPFIGLDLAPGDYLIEIASSRPVSPAFEDSWYKLRTDLPTPERTYADVQQVGNTGLNGTGMTLGQFLDARGSLIYGAHPDADPTKATDPFYPESLDYPWLPFTTDRCSIPGADVPVIGDSILAAFNFKDRPIFDTVAVPFIYGCMRHDFNWRNLWNVEHRMDYMAGHADGPWRTSTMHEANGRLGIDLRSLCEVDGSPKEPDLGSMHFTWSIPRGGSTGDTYLTQCRRKAADIEDALGTYGTLAFATIDYWDSY